MTKSFVSCLFGIAIDEGYIDNVSQRVLSFFPNRSISNWDERKERITLEHLLTMHSGLFWDEGSNSYDLIPSDGTQYVLELDMVSEPGEIFHYSSGVAHLLSSIIQQTTGLTALEFAQDHLFGSLGITDVFWSSDAIGVTIGGFNLSIRSQDAAKFGYLYLNNGTWDGEQIISHDWVKKSTSTFIQFNAEIGYGYQWWTNPAQEYYYALGLYGQYIFVVPKQDLVVVFSSSIQEYFGYPNESLLKFWILAAIQDDTSSVPRFDPFYTTILVTYVVLIVFAASYWVYKTRKR
ncbi:MAG: serine hydrolase domain-containing protein [Candidatus Thorarchaeota archaeon]